MNILFLLTDQWPRDSFGRYHNEISTPNMDRLAGEGTVFNNAFTTCPLCSPARGTLFTGRWTFQTGLVDNLFVGHSTQESLAVTEDTWTDAAIRKGYETAYFGKWHLGHEEAPLERLNLPARHSDPRGFSYENVITHYKKEEKEKLIEGDAPFYGILPGGKEDTLCFRTAARGVDFLENYAAGDRQAPFCLTLSTASPHFPHYLPREYADRADPSKVTLPGNLRDSYKNKPPFHNHVWWPSMDTSRFSDGEWKKIIAYTHQHISMTDEALGTVLDALDRLNLTEETIILFTADHGDMPGVHNRFDKGAFFYEEVWRVPLVVRHPGRKAAEQDSYVNHLDLAETFYSLIDEDGEPAHPRGGLRCGRSLLPLLGCGAIDGRPNRAFGVYDLYNGLSMAVRAIRDERYKFVWNPQSVNELYDLKADPLELVNSIDTPAGTQQADRLWKELDSWMARTGDPLRKNYMNLPPWGTILSSGKMGP